MDCLYILSSFAGLFAWLAYKWSNKNERMYTTWMTFDRSTCGLLLFSPFSYNDINSIIRRYSVRRMPYGSVAANALSLFVCRHTHIKCGALTGNAKLTLNWISFENNFWNVFTFAMRWKLKRRHRAPVNILIYWAQSSIRVSGVSGGFNFSRRCECEIHSKWQRHASTTFFYEFFRIPLRRICWIRFHLQVPII